MKAVTAALVAGALVFAVGAPAATPSESEIEQEQRLRYMSDEFDELIRRSDVLLDEPELVAYLQEIVDRLFPEQAGELKVHLHRDSATNAFVLQNGSVYVNAGLLARLTDEAQLAMVLAHEGEHYVRRHMVHQALTTKSGAAAGAVFGLAIGVPAAGALLAGSSIAGFSREREREADSAGFARAMRAGYSTAAAYVPFERMAREADATDRNAGGGIFGSHPRLTERAETLRELAGDDAERGDRAREEFLARTRAVRVAALSDQLERRRHVALRVLLEDEDVLASYRPGARFFLGEAYRLRGDDGDLQRADANFRQAVAEDPGFAPAWRGLGLFQLRQGNKPDALAALERFLELEPDAADAAFIRRYIEQLQGASP